MCVAEGDCRLLRTERKSDRETAGTERNEQKKATGVGECFVELNRSPRDLLALRTS